MRTLEQKIHVIYADILQLPLEIINSQSNFFQLGGTSLLAIKMAHRMSRAFNVYASSADVFRAKTPKKLAKLIQSITTKNIVIPSVEGLMHYPLSFAQERLWFIEQYEQGSNAYHIPMLLQLANSISLDALFQTIQAIGSRHQILRSVLVQNESGRYSQEVREAPLEINIIPCETKEIYQQYVIEDINRPFNLQQCYPIRICLYEINHQNNEIMRYLLINTHHMANDGWSMEILAKELIAYYDYYHTGNALSLPELPIQYKDFSVWQRHYVSEEILATQLNYWQTRLAGYEILQLATDKKRPPQVSYEGGKVNFRLTPELSDKLRMLSKTKGTTLYTVLLAGFYVLLHKYSHQIDLIVGSPIANRHYESIKDLIGFFVNIFVQREQLDINQPISFLIAQIHEHLIEAQYHQDIPFEQLVDALKIERDTRRHPLFQVLFTVQSFGQKLMRQATPYFSSVSLKDMYTVTRFDLECFMDDSQSSITGIMLYATSLYCPETIQRFVEHYINILNQLVNDHDKALQDYQILSFEEYQRIVYDWNQTTQAYPDNKTIHQLFEEQVARTPNNIAIVYEKKQITYQMLNEKANQLAHYLRNAYAIQGDDLIALCLERSEWIIIAILGVLKAGAAYVPIDPNFPKERIRYILEDTRAKAVITENAQKTEQYTCIAINLDALNVALIQQSRSNLKQRIKSHHLAYVIYTSGTTGKPKGVMVEHQAYIGCIHGIKNKYFHKKHTLNTYSITHYSFDIFGLEYGLSLLYGGSLTLGTSTFIQLNCDTYDFLQITPSLYQAKYHALMNTSNTRLIIGGEKLSESLFNYIQTNDIEFIHVYGPTETTIWSISTLYDKKNSKTLSIGSPLPNEISYILDDACNPLPIGVIGELCIGGVGLARGYLNQPVLTAEKFIPNAFQTPEEKASNKHARLYKTGDLARYLPDGTIEYIGRNDFQIKIRGFRIELGEIEQTLTQIKGIKQACVLAKERATYGEYNNQYLVGYYVLNQHHSMDNAQILAELAKTLPDYMLPHHLIEMDALPLTTNGKLDRQALFHLEALNTEQYVSPKNALEQQICVIYAEIMGLAARTVGIQDDFFRLGGNSLLAIQLVHRLSKTVDVHLPVAEVFSAKTPEQLAQAIEKIATKNIIIPKAEELTHYPLSFAQERLWFIEQYEQGSNVYHIPLLLQLNERISQDALILAIHAIVQRHEILRSVFAQDESGVDYQVVKTEPLDIKIIACNTQKQYQQQVKHDMNTPFDLRKSYPIRVCLYKVKQNNERVNYLLINQHHIATDGWSLNILQQELLAYYEFYHAGVALSLSALSIQYKDFSVWQRHYLNADALEKQLNYWRIRLDNYETLHLGTDKKRPAQVSYEGASIEFNLTPELSDKLRALSHTKGYTLYTVLLAGFYVLLNKHSGQTDLMVGSPTANRNYESIKDLIGFFVNMLVQREQLDLNKPIYFLMAQIHQHLIEAQRHQDLPFEQLVQKLKIRRDMSRHPLFQVMFTVQGFGQERMNSSHQLFHLMSFNDIFSVTRFDLECVINDANAAITGEMFYATSLYHAATIQRFVNHYINILDQMVEEPDKALRDYQILSCEEYQRIVYDWNQTTQDYLEHKTIHQLFEEQVTRTPNNIAIVYEEKQITYQMLNEKANQLAHYLRNTYAIQGDDLIALCLERSEWIIIAILGVLKAGAAYVPIDPNFPEERIRYILKETKAKALITQRHQKAIEKWASVIINIETLHDILSQQPKDNPLHVVKSHHLAYAIYTSGTTGQAKGVMVEHKSVINLITVQAKAFGLVTLGQKEDKQVNGLFYANYVFDAHIWELFTVISNGHQLHLLADNLRHDLSLLANYVEINNIQLGTIPPALLDKNTLFKLKTLVVAGDTTNKFVMSQYEQNNIRVINAYGPTETTVCATLKHYTHGDLNTNIGKPISNTIIYILDQHLNPLPIGAIGELYVGGAGVARGYLNQSELTREKFIANPFQTLKDKKQKKHSRLYKTGDLARYLPDGNIEYIGRNDFQIKIRGFRIELGEIEQALIQIKGIKQACVLAKERATYDEYNNQYLVGYYVLNQHHSMDNAQILAELAKTLPDYMLPHHLIKMDALPLTTNGKLDLNALLALEFINSEHYVAPKNALEQQICVIYAEIMGLAASTVGIQDDFFRLGGNSLLAIQLVHRLSKTVDVHLPVAELFNAKTPEQLAQSIEKIATKNIIIPKAEALEQYPLSFAQERLWFIERYEQGTNVYHSPLLLHVDIHVSQEALMAAIQAIVLRHEILRTVFIQDESGIDYQVVKDAPIDIKIVACNTQEQYQQHVIEDLNSPFNLTQDYPLRVCIYEITQDNQQTTRYLLLNFHHIASDGWSLNILQKELLAYYHYYQTGTPLSLPTLAIQYKDFAVWQRNYMSGEALEKQIDYWRIRLADYETLHLATDKKRPPQISYEGAGIHFSLTPELSDKLRALSREKGYTLYTVLLAGFYVLLNKYSGQTDLMVGSPTANRHYEPIKDLMGFFVNMLVQREQLDVNQPISFLMNQIHQHLIEAQRHQDLPFEKLVQELQLERDTSRHPLFQVMFTVQSFGQELKNTSNSLFHVTGFKDMFSITRFDLECFINDSETSITGQMLYATRLYHSETIQRFVNHYINILTQLVDEQDKLLRDYNVLNPEEYQQVVYDWNKTTTDYSDPDNKTVHQLFEAQVKRTPHNIAVIYEDIPLTYQELNQRTNQLAHYLRETYAIQGDDLIALCLERSEHMIIAILGVLKAGAAYVPIDPHYPEKRIAYILKDTQAKTIITQDDLETWHDRLAKQSTKNLKQMIHNGHLVYVMYTSGSTGQPKGVMITHEGAAMRILAMIEKSQINENSHYLFKTHYVFDVSFSDIFCTLIAGASLFITKHIFNLSEIQHLIEKHAIDIAHFSPSQLDVMRDNCVMLSPLKTIHVSGEKFIKKSMDREKTTRYINYYGPTETGEVTCDLPDFSLNYAHMSTIGRPLNQSTVYLLDQYLNPIPIGAIGELYIGGTGLARGYFNQPELTAAKFIANPFQSPKERSHHKNARLYKTGDLARYLPDGNIEYIGRNDSQIKIRGFRIELGEIENHLCSHPEINQAVVIACEEDCNQYLVAYYIAEQTLDEIALRHYLSTYLPNYMLPSLLVHLIQLPLTPQGKLDRKALPHPTFTSSDNYVAPQNELEERICLLYADILKLPIHIIGIHDDFFRLGGNSLLAIQLTHRLSKTFTIDFPLAELFSAKTIQRLAFSIELMVSIEMNADITTILPTTTELTHEQLWINEQLATIDLNAYSTLIDDFIMPIRSEGSKTPLFVIPGGWGDKNELLSYILMSSHLDPDRPIYGIRSRAMDLDWIMPTTLAEQAKAVFNAIKKIQPQGPYYFLGECIAGGLAVELASLVETQGESPGIIILMDNHPNITKARLNDLNPELPEMINIYYNLLRSAEPIQSKSEVHLLLSSDIADPHKVFTAWKVYFKKLSLHCLSATHTTYVR